MDMEELQPIPQYAETGIPLLRKVWDGIKTDWSVWRQSTWIGQAYNSYGLDRSVQAYIRKNRTIPWDCGTAGCIAGHTVLSKGATFTEHDVKRNLNTASCFIMVVDANDVVRTVETYAAELLGLTDEQADSLFEADNGPYTIEMMVRALERDPDADLYEVKYDVQGGCEVNRAAYEWEQENGFPRDRSAVYSYYAD